jgi:hypothetical protein
MNVRWENSACSIFNSLVRNECRPILKVWKELSILFCVTLREKDLVFIKRGYSKMWWNASVWIKSFPGVDWMVHYDCRRYWNRHRLKKLISDELTKYGGRSFYHYIRIIIYISEFSGWKSCWKFSAQGGWHSHWVYYSIRVTSTYSPASHLVRCLAGGESSPACSI